MKNNKKLILVKALVVDDCAMTQKAHAALLRLLGFEVVTASGRCEALQKVDASFDLVLTDIEMPEGTGISLAKRLKLVAPELPVYAISTLFPAAIQELAGEGLFVRVMMKPLTKNKANQLLDDMKQRGLSLRTRQKEKLLRRIWRRLSSYHELCSPALTNKRHKILANN